MLHYGILIQIQTGVGGLAIFNQHWHLWCFTAGSSEHSSSSSLLPLPQRVQAGQPTNRGGAGHNILKLTTDQWLILWWPLNYTGENRSEDRTYPALAHWHLWRLQEEQRVSLISRLELLQCPQVCHLHDWVQCGGLCALPALHAYLPCGGDIKS